MNRVLIDLGIIQINWYSFFILIAMLTATFIVFKEAKKKELEEDILIDLVFYGIILVNVKFHEKSSCLLAFILLL